MSDLSRNPIFPRTSELEDKQTRKYARKLTLAIEDKKQLRLFDYSQTLQLKDIKTKGPWMDVRAFGAIADGATECSAGIQAAIDAAELVGGVLIFPPGTYIIDTGLTVTEPVHIIGYGAVIKQEADANQASVLSVDLSSKEDISIIIKVDGNMDNNDPIIGIILKDIVNCYSNINVAAVECDTGIKIMGECEANTMFFNVSYNTIGVLEQSTGGTSSDENTFFISGKNNATHYKKDTTDEGHNSYIHFSCESASADAIIITNSGAHTILSGICRGCEANGVRLGGTTGFVTFDNLYMMGDSDSGWGILCDDGDRIDGDVWLYNFDDGGVWIKEAAGNAGGCLGIYCASIGADDAGGPALRLGEAGETTVSNFIVKEGSYLYSNGETAIRLEDSQYCKINSNFTSGVTYDVVFAANSVNDTVILNARDYDAAKIAVLGTNSKVKYIGLDISTFANDVTPSVLGFSTFISNAATLTITRFDNGYEGQKIAIISGGVTTFDTSSNTRLKGSSADIVTAAGDVTMWVCHTGGTTSSVWYLAGFVDSSADNSAGA